MTPERYRRITEVLQKRQTDLTVVTDEIHTYRNIAAIVRTCDAVGVQKVHCAMPADGYQNYMGASASADKWVESVHYSSISEPLDILKRDDYQLLAAHLTHDSKDYREVDYTKPTAIIMGAERKGVSDLAMSKADEAIVIPMMGMVESFNVSVAAALILAEARSQRSNAGFYDEQRLPQNEYDRLFFQWAHPVLTEFCDEHSLAYPAVDEEGEVINLSQWYASVR